MDEPLAALDLTRKQEILPYLERLHDELEIPVIYVSHAPDEVARLADHVVLLAEGASSQRAARDAGRLDLPTTFADDAGVVIEAVVAEHEADDLTRLVFPGGHIYVSRRDAAIGHRFRCRILARDVSLALLAHAGQHPQSVAGDRDRGGRCRYAGACPDPVGCGWSPLIARITRRSLDHLGVDARSADVGADQGGGAAGVRTTPPDSNSEPRSRALWTVARNTPIPRPR